MAELTLKNTSDLEFKDISGEAYRTYVFPSGDTLTIENPQWLNVSASGGHRVVNLEEKSFYVSPKWLYIVWEPNNPDREHFRF